MKPRKRENQKQSARMVLRNNDHRDIIKNDVYHNFIWAKTADINDKLIWQKYPRKALIGGGYHAQCNGWMDVERQFQFARRFTSAGNKGIFYVDGLIVFIYHYSDNSRTLLISEDGMIWKDVTRDSQISTPFVPYEDGTQPFGTKGICNVQQIYVQSDQSAVIVLKFDYSEELEKWVSTKSITTMYRAAGAWWTYWGPTENGAIIEYCINTNYGQYKDASYERHWYLWGYNGERVEMSFDLATPYVASAGPATALTSAAMCGNITCRIAIGDNPTHWGSSERIRIMNITTTLDNGATFYTFSPEEYPRFNYYDTEFGRDVKCGIFVRGAVFYALWSTNFTDRQTGRHAYEAVMYKSTNGISWIKVDLPTYVEVNLIHTGGACIGRRAEDRKLKIAIDPQNAGSYDLRLHDLIHRYASLNNACNLIDTNEYNIMFKDGEYNKTDFYLTLRDQNGYYVYFDNEQLNGENCFAWTIDPNIYDTAGVTGLADVVQEDDYCAPVDFGMVVDDADPVGYNYYIWDNDSYTKVYSTTPYTHHYVVVVTELPAQGAANVLYKVPYYLSMTDWTDNVDYGE